MTKAFRGYINYIKDDDDAKKAWDFAAHVALEQLLLDSWNGVRRDRLPTAADKDTDPPDRPLESDPTIDPTDTHPQPDTLHIGHPSALCRSALTPQQEV